MWKLFIFPLWISFRTLFKSLQNSMVSVCEIPSSRGSRISQTQWGRVCANLSFWPSFLENCKKLKMNWTARGARDAPLGSANTTETVSLSLQNNMVSVCEIPIRNSIRIHSVKNNLRNTDQKELRRKLIKARRLQGNWWTSDLRENCGIRYNPKRFIGEQRCESAAWISPWWFTRVRRAPHNREMWHP